MKKKLILLFISCITIVAFFMIPLYGQWFQDKLWYRVNAFGADIKHMSLEDRKLARYKAPYKACIRVTDDLKKMKVDDPLIMLPPPAFIKACNADFTLPEPAAFYYFTGCRAVMSSSPGAENATWVITFNKNKMQLLPLHNRDHAAAYVKAFNKFVPNQ